MIEVYSAFQQNGLNPEQIIPDGKLHRFKIDRDDKKKSGWYVCHQNSYRGSTDIYYVACYGSLRDHETFKYKPGLKELRNRDPEAAKEIADAIKKAELKAEKEKLLEREEVAKECSEVWESLPNKTTESTYLFRKQIEHVEGLGVKSKDGNLFVPMKDIDGKLWSLQKILPDGMKLFEKGGKVAGCFHLIGDLESSETVYIAEGFATAATVFEATKKPVFCAFNANNLIEVSKQVARKYRDKKIFICADNDKWKDPEKNPGLEAGKEAARVSNGTLLYPVFEDVHAPQRPTDYNDLHVLEGLDAVREELVEIDAETKRSYVMCLGNQGSTYFFTSSMNQTVVPISRFTKVDLFNLMPLSYWMNMYPKLNADNVESLSTFDVDQAASDLMSQCHKIGYFDTNRIRGCGVWRDKGKTVINQGDQLIVDGKSMDYFDFKSFYMYARSKKMKVDIDNRMTKEECAIFVRACETIKWNRPSDAILLAGCLALSRICGAIPVRPHLWITGERGSGKTYLLQKLVLPIMGANALNIHGRSTEAGVRQTLQADATPILFDEFETTANNENQQKCLEMLRAAWSETDALTVKGSAGGMATAFHARCSAVVSSIRVNLLEDADKSRFSVIELMPNKGETERFKKLQALTAQINSDYGDRMFSRIISMIDVYFENLKLFKKLLVSKVDSRFSDQYGSILAGYALLVKDSFMEEAEANLLIMMLSVEEEENETKELDQVDALHHLLTSKLDVHERGRIPVEVLIHEVVTSKFIEGAPSKTALEYHGIRVQDSGVFIESKNSSLNSAVFKGTKWASGGWSKAFRRIPDSIAYAQTVIHGRRVRGVTIPLTSFV